MLFIIFLLGCVSDHYLSYGIHETEKEYIYVQDNFIEGESEPEWPIWVDSFVQPQTSNGVDILWVIDGSGSMNGDYPKVIQGISDMLTSLPMISWRLMIMSMTGYESAAIEGLPLIPGDTTQDALDMFTANVQGNNEKGFEAVFEFMANSPDAHSWMRNDAALLIVFVSDEDDGSISTYQSVTSFASWLDAQRNNIYVSSIINVHPDVSVCNGYTHDIGFRYIELTERYNGNIIDICSDDWSQGVADASSQIQPREFLELTHVPNDPNDIYVFVDGVEFSHWTYDATNNRVVFTILPPENSLVEIAYYY